MDPIKVFTDTEHALGFQATGGTGVGASAGPGSAEATIYLGGFWAEDISNLEGFGTEIGGSGGEIIIIGGGIWSSGEETASEHKYGGYLCAGLNVTGSMAEGHAVLTETSPTFYPVELLNDIVDDLCGNIRNAFNGGEECPG